MGIPAYSESGLAARDLFYGSVASLHFFVEDERLENLYEVIFKRVSPVFKNFKIFPLSGKKGVLAHVKAGYDEVEGVRRIYLLDRDYDDIAGLIEEHPGLFYLDHYCIENVVLDEDALLNICVQERPRVRKEDSRRAISYRETLSSWIDQLDALHRAFALVQKHGLGISNTDIAPEAFTVRGDPSVLSQTKIDAYVEQVCRLLLDNGVIDSAEEYGELSRKVFGSARKDFRRINGKFVARLHYHRLKRDRLLGNINQDSFVFRCAQHSTLHGMRQVVRRIRIFLQ